MPEILAPGATTFLVPTGPVDAGSTGATPAIQGTSYATLPTSLIPGTPGSASGVVGASGTGVGVVGTSSGNDAINGTSSSAQHAGVSANNTGGGYGLWAKATTAGQFEGNVAVNGQVNINGNQTVAGKLTANGQLAVTSSSGQAIAATSTDQNTDCIYSTTTSGAHAGVSANNTGGGFGLWASSTNGTAIYGQSNNVAAQFNGAVNVNGTLNHTGDVFVSGTLSVGKDILLPAQDCAEDFDLEATIEAEPGDVMVLNNEGGLEPSSQPYDKRVAGVISGAGAYRPGLILGRFAPSDARAPVALIGKVYCKVDAQYGRVSVGDLLTTSATPGHAMKASDPLQAFGAVIGKALRPLESGQALIPILVALQ